MSKHNKHNSEQGTCPSCGVRLALASSAGIIELMFDPEPYGVGKEEPPGGQIWGTDLILLTYVCPGCYRVAKIWAEDFSGELVPTQDGPLAESEGERSGTEPQ